MGSSGPWAAMLAGDGGQSIDLSRSVDSRLPQPRPGAPFLQGARPRPRPTAAIAPVRIQTSSQCDRCRYCPST